MFHHHTNPVLCFVTSWVYNHQWWQVLTSLVGKNIQYKPVMTLRVRSEWALLRRCTEASKIGEQVAQEKGQACSLEETEWKQLPCRSYCYFFSVALSPPNNTDEEEILQLMILYWLKKNPKVEETSLLGARNPPVPFYLLQIPSFNGKSTLRWWKMFVKCLN